MGPPAPMADIMASTYGCCATIAAAACWCRAISSKEMSCAASVEIRMMPVSSVGIKPRGNTTTNQTVSMAIRTAIPITSSRCRRLIWRVRS